MADYLIVPQARRDRVVHEKARTARRGELHWLRSYIEDLYDSTLFGEPPLVRFLDVAILHAAARSDWIIPYDPRALAGPFGFRADRVREALARLVELGRFDLEQHVDNLPGGSLQLRLPTESGRLRGVDRASTGQNAPPYVTSDFAQPSTNGADPASERLAQSRAEESRDVISRPLLRDPTVENPATVHRHREDLERLMTLIGDHADAGTEAVLAHYIARATEANVARVIESASNAKPINRARYVAAALRREVAREPEI